MAVSPPHDAVLDGMDRRQFLGFITALFVLLGMAPRPETRPIENPNRILYWVVVDGKNPFVFGVKKDSEVRGFKSVRPTRFMTVDDARSACS